MLQVTSISSLVGPSVVSTGRGRARGSGFVVATDRVAVLRRSVGGDGPRVRIAGSEQTATVVADDPRSGLALLEVRTGPLTPVQFAAPAPELGSNVFALGDPGTGLRITEGRVSAAPLEIRSATGGSLAALEHTAPLPRGTGGGPLLDEDGALVGVNVLRGDPGFILALATSVVQPSVERMLAGGPQRTRLGVAVAPAPVAARLRRAVGLPEHDGVLVRDVEPGSLAEAAGVRTGDLLVRLGGTDLAAVPDLLDALETAGPSTPLELLRGAEELTLKLEPRGSDR
jgi:serine protease Do